MSSHAKIRDDSCLFFWEWQKQRCLTLKLSSCSGVDGQAASGYAWFLPLGVGRLCRAACSGLLRQRPGRLADAETGCRRDALRSAGLRLGVGRGCKGIDLDIGLRRRRDKANCVNPHDKPCFLLLKALL